MTPISCIKRTITRDGALYQGRQNEAFPVCSSTCANEISTRGPRASSSVQICTILPCNIAHKTEWWNCRKSIGGFWILHWNSFRRNIWTLHSGSNPESSEAYQYHWFNAQYESLISMDEVWRPSVVYRHPENSLNRLEQHIAGSDVKPWVFQSGRLGVPIPPDCP